MGSPNVRTPHPEPAAEGGICFENRLLRLPVGSPARPSELAHGLYLHPGKRGVVPDG